MSFVQSFFQNYLRHMERNAAYRVHEQISKMDSDHLIRAGISLELLAKGPAAYPWRAERIEQRATVTKMPQDKEAAIRQAITELKSFSDNELADLGISRSGIAHAARYGRPSEDEGHRAAA